MLASLSTNRQFGCFVKRFSHESSVLGCVMRFAIVLPEAAEQGLKVPAVYWLSGLTCTEENFIQKSGAAQYAAAHNIAIVCPDTSPRGLGIEGEDADWDFGTGAGFYLNATEEKWAKYRMYDYITKELLSVIESTQPVVPGLRSISGHSMGGHGAITIALKNPALFKSVSAFAPILNPVVAPWGKKAFSGYLGADESTWKEYDSTELVRAGVGKGAFADILIDIGDADNFLAAQLFPDNFVKACEEAGQKVTLRMQPGYDHSYYFISTFIGAHLDFHAAALKL